MLEMFNILENYDLVSMGFNTPEYLFTFNEALRLSMADGITYFGDPDFYELPIDTLISKEYAKERVENDMPKDGKVNPTLVPGEGLPFEKLTTAAPESGSTTHVSVIDEFGNMVSTTHTIGGYFGSCIVAPGTGFPLNAHLSNQKLDIAEKRQPQLCPGRPAGHEHYVPHPGGQGRRAYHGHRLPRQLVHPACHRPDPQCSAAVRHGPAAGHQRAPGHLHLVQRPAEGVRRAPGETRDKPGQHGRPRENPLFVRETGHFHPGQGIDPARLYQTT